MTRTATHPEIVPRSLRGTVAVVPALVLCLAGCTASASGAAASGTATAAPTSTVTSMPVGDGPIEPGTYRIPSSPWSVADFTVTFPDGWDVQYGHVYTKNLGGPDEIGFYAVDVDDIFTDACRGEGVPMGVGPDVDDLVTGLLEQRGPTAGDPADGTFGGRPATMVELTVPKHLDLGSCRMEGAGLQVWHSAAVDKYFVLLPEWIASVYVLDLDGRRQVFLTTHRPTTSEEDRAELRAVLDSIHIET